MFIKMLFFMHHMNLCNSAKKYFVCMMPSCKLNRDDVVLFIFDRADMKPFEQLEIWILE